MSRPAGRRVPRRALALAALGAVAVGLRVWRLDWGLADQPGFPDEVWFFTPYAARFVPLSLQSFDATLLLYPTLHGYLVGLAAAAAHALGVVTAPLEATSAEAILLARSVSAFSGVTAVALTGLIGLRMYGARVGATALALMAVAPFHAIYGHLGTTDATLVALVTATLLASHVAAGSTRLAPLLVAGSAAGLAFATKYTGLACIVPVLWAIGERGRRERLGARIVGPMAIAVTGFCLAFAVACPPCILRPGSLLAALQQVYSAPGPFWNNALSPTLGWYGHRYLYQLVAGLPYALGIPLYAAAVLGVIAALWRRTPSDRLLLAATISYFAVIGGSRVVFTRYLLPLFPPLVLLAARVLSPAGAWRGARIVALVTVWTYSLAFATSQIARFSFDQQRAVGEWVARAVGDRPGAVTRVAVPHSRMAGTDYFRLERPLTRSGASWSLVNEARWLDGRPELVVVPEWYAITLERDRPHSAAARELARLRDGSAGYREAARWRSGYLNHGLYTRLDPAFAGPLWQGEVGFAIYERNGS